MKKTLILILIVILALEVSGQKFSGLAPTPPMGWNSWNQFGCNVNEKLIMEIADAMVESGMSEAGYQYINIDDCWHGQRDSLGFIHPDPDRFPSGMKALSDYIHARGLKFGIYSDAGWKTCGGKPGSRGHEYQDALTYASWGVDYLKYDWCYTDELRAQGAYLTMRDALYAAKRPVIFSICEWGTSKPWTWAEEIGHLWRTTGDIYPCFDCIYDHGSWQSWGVMQILDMQEGLREYAGPGHWNDPDMMEVGNGMSEGEDRAHFSMWCMLAAPLIAGNDLRNMSEETKMILTNPGAISINQDPLGIQAYLHSRTDSLETWIKPLSGSRVAICFLNRSIADRQLVFDWKSNHLKDLFSGLDVDFSSTTFEYYSVWDRQMTGQTKKALKKEIRGHDAVMLILSEQKKK
ncbi:MAG: glycoside hydrolase family 27 protein [Bacteroidota bacterium]